MPKIKNVFNHFNKLLPREIHANDERSVFHWGNEPNKPNRLNEPKKLK